MSEQRQKNHDLTAEACKWAATIALDPDNEYERGRFEAWLDLSADHVNAYKEAATSLGHPVFAAAIAQVAHDVSENIAPVPTRTSYSTIFQSWVSRFRSQSLRLPAAAIASVALLVVVSISILQGFPFSPTDEVKPSQVFTAEYSVTGVAPREISFPDGSVAILGAKSAVTLAFTSNERRVTLLDGEGFFEIAPDPSRPFIVRAGDTAVRAVGTAFDVRLAVGSVRIDVVEGEISVTSPNPEELTTSSMSAKAGERLVFDAVDGLMKRPTPPHGELASWRSGWFDYYNEELGRIVSDANRYYDGNIKIASKEIETLKVNAGFPTSGIETVFDELARQVPIVVTRTDTGDILISAKKD